MLDFYPLHMPEDSTPGHCLATFSTVLAAMAIELGTYFDGHMRIKEGPDWFDDLEEYRQRTRPNYQRSRSVFDFSWIINEPCRHTDSPLRDLLPKNEYQFYPTMKTVLDIRNRWYHDFNPHNIVELRKALRLIKYLAEKCGLELADDLVPIIARADAIFSGSYSATPPAATLPTPEATEKVREVAKPIRQAAVGASWLGPVGARKIQLAKSGSLIDLIAEKNVTAEAGNASNNRYLTLWKKLGLDWLWVDELGAVAANVHGSLKMVGYWGESPEDGAQDPFAKFLLPNTYTFADGKLCERENLRELNEAHIGPITKSTLNRGKESVQEGEILRLTWDGDLIYFGDQGPEYVGEVESKDWFPDHFFMPTDEAN